MYIYEIHEEAYDLFHVITPNLFQLYSEFFSNNKILTKKNWQNTLLHKDTIAKSKSVYTRYSDQFNMEYAPSRTLYTCCAVGKAVYTRV